MENTRFKISQYACAVLLIVSSIALVAYQVIMIDDVSNGLLVYVAQAFLLVASIFGLDYYVKLISKKIDLEPARQVVGPILVNSGFRNEDVNRHVGGVPNSQHLLGQAADIRPRDPQQFQRLVDFLKAHQLTDQLLTGNGWLHISWSPFTTPRHQVRIGYYK